MYKLSGIDVGLNTSDPENEATAIGDYNTLQLPVLNMAKILYKIKQLYLKESKRSLIF